MLNPLPKTWTTSQGDRWDLLAYKIYGKASLMNVLLDANPAYQSTVFFDSGTVINVPNISTAIPVFGTPPWRKVIQAS